MSRSACGRVHGGAGGNRRGHDAPRGELADLRAIRLRAPVEERPLAPIGGGIAVQLEARPLRLGQRDQLGEERLQRLARIGCVQETQDRKVEIPLLLDTSPVTRHGWKDTSRSRCHKEWQEGAWASASACCRTCASERTTPLPGTGHPEVSTGVDIRVQVASSRLDTAARAPLGRWSGTATCLESGAARKVATASRVSTSERREARFSWERDRPEVVLAPALSRLGAGVAQQ